MPNVPSILYIGLDDAQVHRTRLAGVRRYAAARGFGSGDALRELFRARMGMSMREFRAMARFPLPSNHERVEWPHVP